MVFLNMFKICRNKCLYCDRWTARRNAVLILSLIFVFLILIDKPKSKYYAC